MVPASTSPCLPPAVGTVPIRKPFRSRFTDLQLSLPSPTPPRPTQRWQTRRHSGLGTGSDARVPWQHVPLALVLTRIGVPRLRGEGPPQERGACALRVCEPQSRQLCERRAERPAVV